MAPLVQSVSEARLRLNASSGLAFSADTEVWFADGRTVDDYLALFRRNNGVRREARVPEGTEAGEPAHVAPAVRVLHPSRRTVCCRATYWSHRGAIMSDKSPRQHMAKKQGKTIKEKRADKRDKANAAASIDPVSRAAKR